LPLLVAQLVPQVELVVLVVGVGREEMSEQVEKRVETLAAVVEPGAEALLEIPCGGVVRAIKRPPVLRKEVLQIAGQLLGDVDDVEAGCRSNF
jgi:hypothetical protein